MRKAQVGTNQSRRILSPTGYCFGPEKDGTNLKVTSASEMLCRLRVISYYYNLTTTLQEYLFGYSSYYPFFLDLTSLSSHPLCPDKILRAPVISNLFLSSSAFLNSASVTSILLRHSEFSSASIATRSCGSTWWYM